MATIDDAIDAQVLELFSLPHWETRLAIRPLWVAFELWDWVDGKDILHEARHGSGGRTIAEHLEQLFCDFRCSRRVGAGDIRRVMPTGHGVLKMHPFGLRVYGWAPAKGAFVAVCAALASDTKNDRSLNDRKRGDVLAFIKARKLEHTIMRDEINAIFPPDD